MTPMMEQPWLEEENALQRLLLTDAELEIVEPSTNWADRLGRVYPLQWKHPKQGEDPRVWINGRSTPRTEPSDIEEHFKKQLSAAKKNRV
jgi:hypothetical protein